MSLETSNTIRFKDPLASWVMGHVEEWEIFRNTEHKTRWDEYYRLWRGVWSPEDRQRLHEKTHAIMPDLAIAVESAVAELDDAAFGRVKWIDIADDVRDDEVEDMLIASMVLREEMELNNIPSQARQAILLAAIYGTGIGKIAVEKDPDNPSQILLRLLPIDPREFVIDPSAGHGGINEALGCAHVTFVPKHIVIEKQQRDIYLPVAFDSFDDSTDGNPNPNSFSGRGWTDADKVKIIEWHGKVPASMLEAVEAPLTGLEIHGEDENYVEAVITIANNETVLRAVQNPYDRAFVAFPWEEVPNSFWGRGVMEKGYWPQKSLDTEHRARTDALALSNSPMMLINRQAFPRGGDFKVRPGRNIFMNAEVGDNNVRPLQFAGPDPQTGQQVQDLKQAIQSATGQQQPVDLSEVSLRTGSSGVAIMAASTLKRSKRAMMNLERSFLAPLVKKALMRYADLDRRFSGFDDARFKVMSTMGLAQQEMEVQQMTQLLQLFPPGSPTFYAMAKSIVDLTSLSKSNEIKELIDFEMQAALEPPPEPQPDFGDQARLMMAENQQAKLEMDRELRMISLQIEAARAQTESERVDVERMRTVGDDIVQQARTASQNLLDEARAVKEIALAEAAEVGTQIQEYQAIIESMKDETGAIAPPEPFIQKVIENLPQPQATPTGQPEQPQGPIEVDRDPETGLIIAVDGAPVERDERNLIRSIG